MKRLPRITTSSLWLSIMMTAVCLNLSQDVFAQTCESLFGNLSLLKPTILDGDKKLEAETLKEIHQDQSLLIEKDDQLKKFIDVRKLIHNGFILTTNKERQYELRDLNAGTHVVGKLLMVNAPFLFQWSTANFHEKLRKAGGISKEDAHSLLVRDTSGVQKGFYVSTNLFDSSEYGEAVNVFQEFRSLLILELAKHSEMGTRKEAARLRSAGIDGTKVTAYDTWFSIINSDLLKNLTTPTPEMIASLINPQISGFKLVIPRSSAILDKINFWNLLPKDNIIYRIYKHEKLSQLEIEEIGNFVELEGFERVRVDENDVSRFFFDVAVKAHIKNLLQQKSLELTERADYLIRRYDINDLD